MKRQLLCLFAGFFILILCSGPSTSLAAPYYEGKVITFIVGYPPGGGYDRMARVLAKSLPKHIPGKPTIIVQNIPGGSSVIAANQLYNTAKPDGLTIAILNRALVFAQLLKVKGIKFDLTKFQWIGSPSTESTVLVIRSDLPYKTIHDLLKTKKEIFLAGSTPASINTQFAMILKEFLGLNIKHVEYRGTAEIWLGMERKEVDGLGDAYNSVRIHIERGLCRPLLRTRISQPGIENLPVNEDLTTNPTGKKIMAMHAIVGGAGRFCVAPPGTSANVMGILRGAFAKAINEDQELKEEAKKLLMDFEYVPAEKCLEIIHYILGQPDDMVKEFSRFVQF